MLLLCLFNHCSSHGTCWRGPCGRQKGDNYNNFFLFSHNESWSFSNPVVKLWKFEFPILRETATLFHCCRAVWGHFLSLWSLSHLAIDHTPFSLHQQKKRGYVVTLNYTQSFPLWRRAKKCSFSACRKAPLALRCFTCHLWLISHSAQCLTVIIIDNALMDDGCLLNTLLPNRQQCSCSYLVEGTSATGRWAHILLGKGLNPAHARIFVSQQVPSVVPLEWAANSSQ